MDSDSSEWASEPIAIIGMSCKFAGGASNPDKLWDLMAAGKTGWSEIPADRYDLEGVYHRNHERTSNTHVKGGHFLDEDVATFDAAFFNYSAEMAQAIDPQFRLQLESTYEALENAGLPLSQVMGSQTSVFAGVFTHDYQEGIIRDEDRLPRFNVVGSWSPMSSNRISHFFDFTGASMTLETGCSTTLVALHQAIQTLRNREADMSVVTGANVMLNPDTFKAIGSLGMLSPDGRSWAFDARANGYGRGEGVATLVIKRLADALAANDPVRAVIRETALNQDGRTDTITTPSGAAQVALIRECYRRAGLDPRGTQYFEAHGTGTPTGDPIEAETMSAIFGQRGSGRDNPAQFLRIGSVKTNVGHTEAASGLAAMIKGVLCLEKGLIPPSVNYETPNPRLKLDEWRLKVATAMEPWPESLVVGGPRRLSVNNFGYGGTNAHVILESAEPWTATPALDLQAVNGNGYTNGNHHHNNQQDTADSDTAKVLILSARDERGCQQMVADMKAYLEQHRSLGHEDAEQLLRNLSYTLAERRTMFPWVAAHQVRLTADNSSSNSPLDAAIQAFDSPRFKPGRQPSSRPRIGMVFTGQGAQWYAMGRELLASYPVFRRSIAEAEKHLRALGADWSLREELHRDAKTTRVHATNISIPVCVALQIALVQLLESWGITPSAVTSHSSGEIAAAFAVGALTHRQAMATAYWRAVLAADETLRAPGAPKGAMAAVGLGADEAQLYLNQLTAKSGKAVIACVNSPQSVTVSGDSDAVQVVEDLCKQDDVFARRLKVQQAYHSHHMDSFAEAYRERLRDEMALGTNSNKQQQQQQKQPKAIFSSAVTGGRIDDMAQIASPDHWVGSLVQAVQFVDAFVDMVLGDPEDPTGRSVDVLLEVGPHTALGGPIREIVALPEFAGVELPYWGCLVRDEHAGDSMRAAAIQLLRAGHPLTMSQINFRAESHDDVVGEEGQLLHVLTDLPAYPWNHTMRHWQEARVNRAIRERHQPPHELLGMRVAGSDPGMAVWRRVLRITETPWLREHMVQGSIVFPGAGYVCLAIEAASQLALEEAPAVEEKDTVVTGFRLRDVEFLFACVVPDSADGVEIRTTLRPVPAREVGARGWSRFEVSSVTLENRWTLHAQGMVMAERGAATAGVAAPEREKTPPLSTYTRHPDPQDMFASLRARGVYHGPLFQNTAKIVQDTRSPRSLCDIAVQQAASSDTDAAAAAASSVLHPITLDAVVVAFYATLPSVGALQEDPKLPRAIGSMWVSRDIAREQGHALRCDTLLRHDDAQSGSADVTVRDGVTDEAVLTLQGLELASLGRGSGATARQAQEAAGNKGASGGGFKWQQEVCSRVEWAADLSLGQPRALEKIKQQLQQREYKANNNTTLGQLSALLRIVAHKNPGARILQVGVGVHATRHLLETLGTPKTPLGGSWHVTAPSAEALEEARAQLADWVDLLEFDQLNIEQGPAQQKFAAESYDIAIVGAHVLRAAKNATGAAASLQSLLRPGGTLLVAETGEEDEEEVEDLVKVGSILGLTDFTASAYDSVLRNAGFSGVDLEVTGTGSGETGDKSAARIIMSTVPLAKNQNRDLSRAITSDRESFALVTSSKTPPPPGFIDQLSQRIQAQTGAGTPAASHMVLEQTNVEAYKDKICVFVGDTHEPVLADLDAATIEGLRAMVTQCSGLLWVTAGGAVEVETPEQALSQGFLRVLRNEYIGRKLLSLDLDPAHMAGHGQWSQGGEEEAVISAIVRVLEEGFGRDAAEEEKAGPADFEYAERDGVLLIPRVYKDEQINDMVTGLRVPSWGEMLQGQGQGTKGKDGDDEAVATSGIPLEPLFQEDRPLKLEVGIPGHLDTLAFVDDDNDDNDDNDGEEGLAPELVEITPRAYGLSSRDALAAMGQLKEDRATGLECAGIITRIGTEAQAKGRYKIGDHVMALSAAGFSFASRAARVPWHGVVAMPRDMDFATAASLPLAFTMAHAGLVDAARLTAGQAVLIHAAAGAVGQAAIMLAKHLGVTDIYATAGSSEKRELLQTQHGIPAERIFSSRDALFAPAVLAATGGRGVDVVLNSLSGPLLQASLEVIAPLGRLVEIGSKADGETNNDLLALGRFFSRGISLTSLDVPTLLRRRGPEVHRMLADTARLIEQQALRPVHPVAVRPMRDVQAAFRFAQTGLQTGRVVLSANPDEQVPVVPRPKGLTARLRLRPDASYLIVGGVGGIGRSVAHWLVAHGAKNLILLSRSAGDLDLPANSDSDGARFVHELRATGCRVKPVSCDVSLASHLAKALRACADAGLPPVRGVVQGAMLLRDAVFEQMTLDDWRAGLQPKLAGTWNLHTQFAQPGSLDFFAMLSSVSGVVGIASQANYAAGGAYEDAIARWRQARGLPGVAIDLGPISDVGYVAQASKVAERLRKDGDFTMLDEDIVLRALNAAVLHPLGGDRSRAQIIVGLNSQPGPQWDAAGRSQLGRDARFLHLRPRSKASSSRAGGDDDGGGNVSLAAQLGEASSRQEAVLLIGTAIAAKLADIFVTPVADIDLSKPPAYFGVDSLVAVELRNMLVLQAAADISIFNILQTASLASLAASVADKSRHLKAPASAASAA